MTTFTTLKKVAETLREMESHYTVDDKTAFCGKPLDGRFIAVSSGGSEYPPIVLCAECDNLTDKYMEVTHDKESGNGGCEDLR